MDFDKVGFPIVDNSIPNPKSPPLRLALDSRFYFYQTETGVFGPPIENAVNPVEGVIKPDREIVILLNRPMEDLHATVQVSTHPDAIPMLVQAKVSDTNATSLTRCVVEPKKNETFFDAFFWIHQPKIDVFFNFYLKCILFYECTAILNFDLEMAACRSIFRLKYTF